MIAQPAIAHLCSFQLLCKLLMRSSSLSTPRFCHRNRCGSLCTRICCYCCMLCLQLLCLQQESCRQLAPLPLKLLFCFSQQPLQAMLLLLVLLPLLYELI
jgi:hypothetical protein